MRSKSLSEFAEDLYSRWLQSVISCCGARDRDEADSSKQEIGIERTMLVCHEQPHLIPPPTTQIWADRPYRHQSQNSFSQWRARSRSLASRASSSRGSFRISRRMTEPKRPSIGPPSDFRRVGNFQRRAETFRPLELSIYLPENRLSPLPIFSTDDLPAQLDYPEYPAPAAFLQRQDSLVSNSQYSYSQRNFRIARKPLTPSITGIQVDGERRSSDTRSTRSISGTEWLHQPLSARPALPDSPSSQDLLAALETRLPKSPPPLRARSMTEPAGGVNRRDSEQYRRVERALQERMDLERRLREIDTILEEKQIELEPQFAVEKMVKAKISLQASPQDAHPLKRFPVRPSTAPDATSLTYRPLPPTPLNFNQPKPLASPIPPPPPPKAEVAQIGGLRDLVLQPEAVSRKPSRSRITSWLFSSSNEPKRPQTTITTHRLPQEDSHPHGQQSFYKCAALTRSSTISTVSTLTTVSDDAATITPPSTSPSKPRIAPLRQQTFGRGSDPFSQRKPTVSPDAFLPVYQVVDPNPNRLSGRSQVGVAF